MTEIDHLFCQWYDKMIFYSLTWEIVVTRASFRWMFQNILVHRDDARIKGEVIGPATTEFDHMVHQWEDKM